MEKRKNEFEKKAVVLNAKEHKITESIPWSDTCFGCNGGSNVGIGMRAYITEDGYAVGLCRTQRGHQGYPDTIHGGIIATYFDEAFWHATRVQDPDTVAMTVEMRVRYFHPVGVGLDIRVVAEPARVEGRHMYVDGKLLLPDDTVAATATIHYVVVCPENMINDTEGKRLKHEQQCETDTIKF